MEWIIIALVAGLAMGIHLLFRIAGRLDDVYEALSSKILTDETKENMSMNTSTASSEEKRCKKCGSKINRRGFCEVCEMKYEPKDESR